MSYPLHNYYCTKNLVAIMLLKLSNQIYFCCSLWHFFIIFPLTPICPPPLVAAVSMSHHIWPLSSPPYLSTSLSILFWSPICFHSLHPPSQILIHIHTNVEIRIHILLITCNFCVCKAWSCNIINSLPFYPFFHQHS